MKYVCIYTLFLSFILVFKTFNLGDPLTYQKNKLRGKKARASPENTS